MILVEITAAINDAGGTQTFFLSNDKFTSKPTDAPANIAFKKVLIDPGSFSISAFSDGRTGGGTRLQTGEILLANNNGQFDVWKDYSFDGRPISIYAGDPTLGYPGGVDLLFTGTIEAVEVTFGQVAIRLKDKQFVFSVGLLNQFYGGTNALPLGIDGTPNDIKGQPKPRVYGKVLNIVPTFVNTSLLVYQVSDRAVSNVDAVYDRGLALTAGIDYATSALLLAATGMAAGTYITCRAEGLFRLASSPAGTITADVTAGASAAQRTAAQILLQMANDAGVITVSGTHVIQMDLDNSAELGIYVNDGASFAQAMDQIANSVGAYYGFDSIGVLRMAILKEPSGVPDLVLKKHRILPGVERMVPRDKAIPPWSVTVNHTFIYNVQVQDIAGAVTQARRAFLGLPRRSARAEYPARKLKWLLASEVSIDTLITAEAAALTEAARLLALFGANRDIFQVPVPLDIIRGSSVEMLSVVSLTMDRFGLSAGKLFSVIGIDLELSQNKVILSLWG